MKWITPFNDIKQMTQGSIVDGIDWGEENNPVSIVLSNACDLEHEHASYLIVAALYPASAIIGSSREYKSMTHQNGFSASSRSSNTKDITKYCTENGITHLLRLMTSCFMLFKEDY